MPIKGEEETSSYEVVCAYQRGGDLFVRGGLCLSKGRKELVNTDLVL